MEPSKIATKEDLQKLKEELKEEIRQIKDEDNATPTHKWLKTKDLQDYLGISTSQIHVLRGQGVLQPKKLGGTLYYRKDEIDQAIEKGEI